MTAIDTARPPRFSRGDHRTLGLAALGGALEIYDFIIFVFFALTLSQLFFPPEMPEWLRLLQSFGIFVTGYLARPLGGILMAHFADHLGRKRVFSLSILMMALPCLLIGVMPTYADIGYAAPLILLALRILQGAAVGVRCRAPGPSSPSMRRRAARLCPGLSAGRADLWLPAGALTATLLAQLFTPQEILDYAWRYPFLLGGVFGVIGCGCAAGSAKRRCSSPCARSGAAGGLPLRVCWRAPPGADSGGVADLCADLGGGGAGGHHADGDAAAFRHDGRAHLRLEQRGHRLSQHWLRAGRAAGRPHRRLACADDLQPAAAAGYRRVVRQPGGQWGMTWLAYALAGLCCGVVGVVPSVMVGLFPAQIRVSGISFTYNIAYALWASTTPLALIALMPWSPWVCVGFCLIMGAVGC
jgi:MFS family permease